MAHPWKQGWLRIVSIDPGVNNFCMRIERQQLTDDGYVTKATEVMFNFKLEGDPYQVSLTLLSNYEHLFMATHLFLVERQYMVTGNKGSAVNYQMVKMQRHLLTYFMVLTRNSPYKPLITEVLPKLKSKYIWQHSDGEKDIKKASVNAGYHLLAEYGDLYGLAILDEYGQLGVKLSDMTDATIQLHCFMEKDNIYPSY